MHTDAQECTKMRMGKNNTTFGKKQHSIHEREGDEQEVALSEAAILRLMA